MKRSKTPNKIDRMDSDCFPSGKTIRQYPKGFPIRLIIEGRNKHRPVRKDVVGVTGREDLAPKNDRPWHGKPNHLRSLSRKHFAAFEDFRVFAKRLIIGMVFVFLLDKDYPLGSDKSRQIIDMAVCVIALDTPIQPQNLVYSQILPENRFIGRLIQTGIALLDFAQETLPGCKHHPGTVTFDGASLQHQSVSSPSGLDHPGLGQTTNLCHGLGQSVIQLPIIVFCPGVKAPIEKAIPPCVVLDKNPACIPHPDPVGGLGMEVDDFWVDPGLSQNSPHRFFRTFGDKQLNGFIKTYQTDNLGPNKWYRSKLSGPIRFLMGPG